MIVKNQVMVLVVVVVVLAAISVYFFFILKAPPSPVSQAPSKVQEIVPPPATGNIDDLINALLKELSDEEPVFVAEEGDTVFVTSDSKEVGDFGQSINESEL